MRSGTGRGAASVALAGACVALLAGCGIRTTSVPVDAGAAPSRAACSVDGPGTAAQPRPGIPLRVYLVCGSQLEAVDRTTTVPEQRVSADRVGTASALLMELQSETSDAERTAGFSTAVKGPLVVTGGRSGDPKGALRLSRQPEDLAPTALSQIVCTFAESAAGSGGGTVVLGGPGDYPAHRYQCTDALKDRPDMVVPTASAKPSATAPAVR